MSSIWEKMKLDSFFVTYGKIIKTKHDHPLDLGLGKNFF